jgi:lipoprotein signal peptidase
VVDYVQVKYFAVFNFADACITGAVVVAVLLMLTGRAPSPAPQPEPGSGDQAESTAGDRR